MCGRDIILHTMTTQSGRPQKTAGALCRQSAVLGPVCAALQSDTWRNQFSGSAARIARAWLSMASLSVVSALVSFLVYSNTLFAEFAYDDNRAIKTNPDVLGDSALSSLWLHDFWGTPLQHAGSHKSYRPLTVLSLRANFLLAGLWPPAFHITNVLLHVLVTVLFVRLASARLGGAASAGSRMAALLFAVHPLHTEAVAGVVGRADVGAAAFFLLSFFSYDAYLRQRSLAISVNGKLQQSACHSVDVKAGVQRAGGDVLEGWKLLLLCFVFAGSAMLTKEHGVTVLGVCFVYDVFVFNRRPLKQAFPPYKQRVGHRPVFGAACLLLMMVTLVTVRLWVIGGGQVPNFSPADNPAAAVGSRVTRWLTFSYLALLNLRLLLCPSQLSFDWSMDAVPLLDSPSSDSRSLLVAVVYCCVLLAAVSVVRAFRTAARRRHTSYNQQSPAARKPRSRETTKERLHVWLESHHHTDTSQRSGPLNRRYIDQQCRTTGDRKIPYKNINNNVLFQFNVQQVEQKHRKTFRRHQKSTPTGDNVDMSSTDDISRSVTKSSSISSSSSSSLSSCSNLLNATNSVQEKFSDSDMRLHSSLHLLRAGPVTKGCGCCRQRLDTLLLSVAIMAISFLPASNLFFYVGFVLAERVLYIPSIGFCLLVGAGYQTLLCRWCSQDQSRHKWRLPWRRLAVHTAGAILLTAMAARAWQRNFDWQDEESLYRSGLEVNPAKAYGNLANILVSKGMKKDAEKCYKTALSYRHNMADVHYNLGILYQEEKRYDEALQCYDRAILYRPSMAVAHLNKGLVLCALGRRAEAAVVYRHCAHLDGSRLKDPRTHQSARVSALFNLARLISDDGNHRQALDVYLQAVNIMPPHYEPQSLYNMLGEAYFKLNKLDEAERWYLKSIAAKPDHIPAHLTYGKLLASMNRYNEAQFWFSKAVTLAPDTATVHHHYGQYLLDSGRLSEAVSIYKRAVQLSPDDYEIVFNTANALRQAGANQEAEHYYRQAVKLHPQEAGSHMNLGAMLHVNGKLDEAEQCYEQALLLSPNDQITRTNMDKLKKLKRNHN